LGQDEILMESFSKKRNKYISKNVRPFIADMKGTKLELPKESFELVDEVTACENYQGIEVTAQLIDGSSIRPVEILKSLKGVGLDVERPIKTNVILA
jgi:hypothetical protein